MTKYCRSILGHRKHQARLILIHGNYLKESGELLVGEFELLEQVRHALLVGAVGRVDFELICLHMH